MTDLPTTDARSSGSRLRGVWARLSVEPRSRLVEIIAVFVGYTVLSAVLYQTPLVGHADSLAAGLGLPDNDAYVWMLGWPAHAIAHGLNPFFPKLVFEPEGYNLALATPMFTFGFPLAPLTWLAGPLVTYNVVMLAFPALNGISAYALSRRLGARPPAAALGGFVFATAGIVTFAELGAPTTGCGAFLALGVLLTLDLLDGRRTARWAAVLLGLDLVAQLYTSAEALSTFLLFGAIALALCWVLDVARRPQLRVALRPLAGAAAILALGGLPYVLAFLSGGTSLAHANPNLYPDDALAFAAPSALQLFGHTAFGPLATRFPGESQTAYIGVGLILITIVHLVGRWRTDAGARILAIVLMIIFVCSLGTHLTIAGYSTIPLPWNLIRHLPLLRYALPSRLSIYLALGAAIVLPMWLARSSGWISWAAAAASCALLIPNPDVPWATSLRVPTYFTSGTAERQLAGHRVLVLPYASHDDADQALANYSFSMAGGYLGQYPNYYGRYIAPTYLIDRVAPPGSAAAVAQLVRVKHVDTVVVSQSAPGPWKALLSGLGVRPVSDQGVLIYRLADR